MNKAFVMPSNSHSDDKGVENSPNFDSSPCNDDNGFGMMVDQMQFNSERDN